MNVYNAISSYSGNGNLYELSFLMERGRILKVVLEGKDSQLVEIEFEDFMMYRKMDEGDALRALNDMAMSSNERGSLYRVDDSEFISWFNDQSFNAKKNMGLKHFVISTMDDLIDVISLSSPSIKNT